MRIKVLFEEGEVDGRNQWILDDIRDAIADYSAQCDLPLPTLDVVLVEPGDE